MFSPLLRLPRLLKRLTLQAAITALAGVPLIIGTMPVTWPLMLYRASVLKNRKT
jgi:hypothetical protein